MENKKKVKLPIILYENEEEGKGSPIPYISVEKDDFMPPVLFIFEYKETGEIEPGDEGQELSIVEQIPHQYIDMSFIKEKVSPEIFDELRVSLGMKTLKEARQEGAKIMNNVMKNLQISGISLENEMKESEK